MFIRLLFVGLIKKIRKHKSAMILKMPRQQITEYSIFPDFYKSRSFSQSRDCNFSLEYIFENVPFVLLVFFNFPWNSDLFRPGREIN